MVGVETTVVEVEVVVVFTVVVVEADVEVVVAVPGMHSRMTMNRKLYRNIAKCVRE